MKLIYLKNCDIITLSGSEDEDAPVIDGDANSELPFVPRK